MKGKYVGGYIKDTEHQGTAILWIHAEDGLLYIGNRGIMIAVPVEEVQKVLSNESRDYA